MWTRLCYSSVPIMSQHVTWHLCKCVRRDFTCHKPSLMNKKNICRLIINWFYFWSLRFPLNWWEVGNKVTLYVKKSFLIYLSSIVQNSTHLYIFFKLKDKVSTKNKIRSYRVYKGIDYASNITIKQFKLSTHIRIFQIYSLLFSNFE